MRLRRHGTLILSIAAPLSALHLLLSPDAAWMNGPNLLLLLTVAGSDAAERLSSPGILATTLVVVGVVGAALFAVVRFWLWERARNGSGAWPLLSAAVIGALSLLPQAWHFALGQPWWTGVHLPDAVFLLTMFVDHAASVWGWIISPLVLLLMGAGLLRSRMVSPWVAIVAVVAAILYAANWAQTGEAAAVVGSAGLLDALLMQMYVPAVVAEVVFLVGTGVSLLRREARRVSPDVHASESAGSVVEQSLPADGVEL